MFSPENVENGSSHNLRYEVACIVVNPAMFGAPIERRRLYMVMIRYDCLSDETLEYLANSDDPLAFTRLIADRVCSMNMPCKWDWNLVSQFIII